MTPEQARDGIVHRMRVTKADVTSAKAFLLESHGRIPILEAARQWAQQVSPGSPAELSVDSDDIDDQISRVSRFLSAQAAVGTAAWELVHDGVAFLGGPAAFLEPSVGYATAGGRYRGGLQWDMTHRIPYPEAIFRPTWHEASSELWDADLYLRRLSTSALQPGVERAIRMSLECFRREMYVPSVVMLGAASEGAWIELGRALSARHPSEPRCSRLRALLDDPRASIRNKIAKTCELYDQAALFDATYVKARVDNRQLHQVAEWSDVVREARNVLHWDTNPSVPNTYEKVAVLLMSAVPHLSALHTLRDGIS
jgi:hypothetical protein